MKKMSNKTSGQDITADSYPNANSYNECLRQCDACMVGYSNSKSNPTLIFKDPLLNIPVHIRGNINEVLACSLNIKTRKTKLKRIGFNTSEDALSWTVFRYSQKLDNISALMKYITGEKASEEITVYYWGVPLNKKGEINNEKQDYIQKLLIDMGEKQDTLSEPDIILEDSDSVVFFEVKLSSSNDYQTPSDKWNTYKNNSYFQKDITTLSGKYPYQLFRNWYIGNKFAEQKNRKFYLINLVLKRPKDKETELLKSIINETDSSRFKTITWNELLNNCFTKELPEWLITWLRNRKPEIKV